MLICTTEAISNEIKYDNTIFFILPLRRIYVTLPKNHQIGGDANWSINSAIKD